MRRTDNKTAYRVTGKKDFYIVVMARIKNDVNGNPRFSAEIISGNRNNSAVYCYTFTGHYMSEEQEAQFIVDRHEA